MLTSSQLHSRGVAFHPCQVAQANLAKLRNQLASFEVSREELNAKKRPVEGDLANGCDSGFVLDTVVVYIYQLMLTWPVQTRREATI